MNTISNATYTTKKGNVIAYFDSQPNNNNEIEQSAIVLIHGYCGSSAYFEKLIPLIAQETRVIAIDLPGHGHSASLLAKRYSMQVQAELVLELVEQLSITKFHVFGHSLGGYITLALAAKKPEGLTSFGLLHSTALPDSEQAKLNREQAIKTVEKFGVSVFVEQLVPKLLAEDHPQYEHNKQSALLIGYSTHAESVIGFAYAMKERADLTDVIHQSTLPVLLVSGAKDRVVNAEGTFAGRNETTRCHIIDDAGHMGMLETPEILAELINNFTKDQP